MIDESMIPDDDCTQSLFRKVILVSPYEAVLDVWTWEGIQGWSYVFATEDVSAVPDEALVALVKEAAGETLMDALSTVKRGDKTVFVNLVKEPQQTWPSFDPVDRRSHEEKENAKQGLYDYLKHHNALQVSKARQK